MIQLYEMNLINRYGKTVCEKNWKWHTANQPLEDYDVWYAWKGEGHVSLDGRVYGVKRGTCFCFRPGDQPRAEHNPDNPLTVTFLHFTLRSEPRPFPEIYYQLERPEYFETLLERYIELMEEKPLYYETETKLIVSQLLIFLIREQRLDSRNSSKKNRHMTEHFQEVASIIRRNPGKNHSIAELALPGMNPKYFAKKFKEIMGIPFQSFVIHERLERAEQLLKYYGMNVTEVSDALGYRDIYFFSRQFKKIKGISPSSLIYK